MPFNLPSIPKPSQRVTSGSGAKESASTSPFIPCISPPFSLLTAEAKAEVEAEAWSGARHTSFSEFVHSPLTTTTRGRRPPTTFSVTKSPTVLAFEEMVRQEVITEKCLFCNPTDKRVIISGKSSSTSKPTTNESESFRSNAGMKDGEERDVEPSCCECLPFRTKLEASLRGLDALLDPASVQLVRAHVGVTFPPSL